MHAEGLSNVIIKEAYDRFLSKFDPIEGSLTVLTDNRTGATYCECHIKASKLIALGTTDVPLDPNDQAEYRANREIVEDAYAFKIMKEDAKKRRSFSNIVTEYTEEFDESHPLKVIGGQHRFQAIKEALTAGIDEYHGVKVYLGLNTDQRLDVQLISNTNIAASGHLFDRMQETVRGPHFRQWCQCVGFLADGEDFADQRQRGGPITVQLARTFITNYYLGQSTDPKVFDYSNTTPTVCQFGRHDEDWDKLHVEHPNLWQDEALKIAASEFTRLHSAQREAFVGRHTKFPPDYPEKAMNAAVLASWAYTAGILQANATRLKRHYALAETTGRDPLNAAALAKGRHKTDPENYRGLGYRTDAKERARLVELFYYQAEDGKGITSSAVDIAIKKYHAKQAQLEVLKAEAKEK